MEWSGEAPEEAAFFASLSFPSFLGDGEAEAADLVVVGAEEALALSSVPVGLDPDWLFDSEAMPMPLVKVVPLPVAMEAITHSSACRECIGKVINKFIQRIIIEGCI